MPATVSPKVYVRALDDTALQSGTKATQPAEEISAYVQDVTEKLGWKSSDQLTAESVAHMFMQLRLRQIDAACGSIKWDSSSKHINSPWYKGIVRPLTLLRDTYDSYLSLADFEAMTPEQAMKVFNEPLRAENAPHIANYIAAPYYEYVHRPDLLETFAVSLPLRSALKLSSTQLLRKPLITNCYKSPLDLATLQEISARIDDSQLKADISAATILHPSRLEDIRDIRNSSADAQFNTISGFISGYPTSMFRDIWPSLDTLVSVFPLVDIERLRPLVLQEAMKRGEFGTIVEQRSRWPAILVQNLATEFIERARAKLVSAEIGANDIPIILQACEIANEISAKEQFIAAQTICTRYNLAPDFVLASTPIALLKQILEVNPRAYQQKALIDQISKATGTPLDPEYAKGQFVEFALVDNNFNAAVQFCESMDPKNDSTWIAYLQTTRFVSSIWDNTPPKILAKKSELIVKCIEICPPGDMASVLKSYESLTSESSNPRASSLSPVNSSSSGPRTNPKPRKRVQNLLVSGIGWAIGAPTEDSD